MKKSIRFFVFVFAVQFALYMGLGQLARATKVPSSQIDFLPTVEIGGATTTTPIIIGSHGAAGSILLLPNDVAADPLKVKLSTSTFEVYDDFGFSAFIMDLASNQILLASDQAATAGTYFAGPTYTFNGLFDTITSSTFVGEKIDATGVHYYHNNAENAAIDNSGNMYASSITLGNSASASYGIFKSGHDPVISVTQMTGGNQGIEIVAPSYGLVSRATVNNASYIQCNGHNVGTCGYFFSNNTGAAGVLDISSFAAGGAGDSAVRIMAVDGKAVEASMSSTGTLYYGNHGGPSGNLMELDTSSSPMLIVDRAGAVVATGTIRTNAGFNVNGSAGITQCEIINTVDSHCVVGGIIIRYDSGSTTCGGSCP